MAQLGTENCIRCGKEINMKLITTYTVLRDYSIVCDDCERVTDRVVNVPRKVVE